MCEIRMNLLERQGKHKSCAGPFERGVEYDVTVQPSCDAAGSGEPDACAVEVTVEFGERLEHLLRILCGDA